MLWLACVLAVIGVVLFVAGLVLFANGSGVAPHRRTSSDPTGVRRATTRVAWPDLFRGMRRCLTVMRDESANRSDRLAAAGSLLVLTAIVAGFVAVLALIAALV
ncbi:hypothetical protein A5791_08600 [Mycobacterium sp. 852002-51163_SCH5372311]|uniref:hypothetical protein n=1 Tax=Mycobacterium sp. 852002-51163_SCH5372311 TaxID=1834097 RepID=UPI0007FDEA0E|nr:hypothetical protein [Mycobacterium sp. 852002-51163_SCH5372311]OBF80443.1 hypothetical protein A5791_08600 [Mycobacterium sp. 852002-51163_SCH5372311]